MATLNAATRAQGPSKESSSSGEKVFVFNKLPFPLRIHVDFMRTVVEEQRNGTKIDVQVAERSPDTIVIYGAAIPRKGGPPCRHYEGYAITEGVPKDFYDKWAEANKSASFILNKLVFAMPQLSDGEAIAKENRDRITNLEPLNPDGDSRTPRPAAGMSEIKTAVTNE